MLAITTPSKANPVLMRELNEQVVLRLLRAQGTISRAELARQSNLSRSTISNIIAALLASGLVREAGVGRSQGGRRPIMIEFNYQSSFVLGVAASGAQLCAVLADLTGTVLRRSQRTLGTGVGVAERLHQVAALLSDTLAQARVPHEKVLGMGVCLPSDLPAPLGQLRGRLADLTGMAIWAEHDAYLGALAEHRWGAARGHDNVVYLHVGATVSCGLILEGRLYRGALGAAGAIGHLVIDEQGPACRCGAAGCLEALVGEPALLARAQALGLACDQLSDLAGLARAGAPAALALVEAVGASLGSALASLLTIVNPSCVVLGGELAAAGEPLLRALREQLARRAGRATSAQVPIVPGALGADVIALGGAALVALQAFALERQERG